MYAAPIVIAVFALIALLFAFFPPVREDATQSAAMRLDAADGDVIAYDLRGRNPDPWRNGNLTNRSGRPAPGS